MRPWGWGVTLTLELIGVGVLILLNAFFVAAEYALVTARRTRIIELHHQGNRRARAVLKITSDPQQFIAAMQLGVTLTSLGIGALGEQALARAFESWLATVLAVLLAYLILTYFHVVIGELVPKGVALGHPEGTALWVAAPVRAFFTLFAPFVWVLRRSTDAVLHLLGLEPPSAEREPLSEAELRMLLSRSSEQGEIEHEEQQMIDKVFVFGDKDVADVMVPRPEVVAISAELPSEEALAAVLDSPYTRYPVYGESLDDIIGVLHVRDLFTAVHDRGLASVRLAEIVRSAYIVPETKDLASLLQEFRKTNNHFAVVVDEYGGMAGICTLEDLLEEIVGEIEDEFDVAEVQIEQLDDDTYRIDGMFPIDEFNARFGTSLPDDDFHTLAGFVFGQLGRAPQPGDDVEYDGMRFDVLEVDGNRIEKLVVNFIERPSPRRENDELRAPEDDQD
ncbi:MAG: magnesium and cobalt exporter, family [Gaiellaceae bacterium]|jgi:CBS domain containing-hemolysin-like protein|nr:magnesium and cobalt exporter, family [Gaiellaceae bacterium]